MAKKITGPQVLTANLLGDGYIVFYGEDGHWHESLAGAQLAHGEDEVARLEAAGAEADRASLVVGPYLVEVEEGPGGLVPVEFRERMRLAGPSVKPDFNARPGALAIAAE